VKSTSKQQLDASLVASRKTLAAIYAAEVQMALNAVIHKSSFMKMVTSFVFSIVSMLVMAGVGLVGMYAGVAVALIVAVVAAIVFVVLATKATSDDQDALEAEAKKYGIDTSKVDGSDPLNVLYNDLKTTMRNISIVYQVTMVVSLVGAAYSKSPMLAMSGLPLIMEGLTKIYSGMLTMAFAGFTYGVDLIKVEGEKWSAMAKFYGEILKRLEESLKNLLQSMQDYIKSQEEFVRDIAGGALSIVRNLAAM
jgi:hypothetical protein